MQLESLEVHHFRNLKGQVSWGNGLNIIFGENGQGKTNWLEAIYLLATTKSFRTQRPQEVVFFDAELAVVRGRVALSHNVQRELQVAIQGHTKSLAVNGKRETVARYLGHIHIIAFTSDELEVVRGGPEARRRFLDRGVVSLHHSYVQTLADYQRIIKQKNRLLHDASESNLEPSQVSARLAPWNEQLISLGAIIHRARVDYVERLKEALDRRLFEREEVTIRYLSSLEGKGDLSDYESLLADRLRLRMSAEISAGYTLIGPHRDDLEILFDGRDMRSFGSSGQQRSALIILDLAAISVYHLWHNEYPLFLMDDVDAELDRKRIGRLLDYLEGRTQTFITTSKESLIERYAARSNAFIVSEGQINEMSSDTFGESLTSTAGNLSI